MESETAATTDTARQTQENRNKWMLEGIAAEKRKVEAYLAYLTQQENDIRGSAIVGVPQRQRTKPVTGGTQRKRTVSEEQRRKQSEAATKRWAERKAAQAKSQESATGAATVASVNIPTDIPAAAHA